MALLNLSNDSHLTMKLSVENECQTDKMSITTAKFLLIATNIRRLMRNCHHVIDRTRLWA